MKIDENDYFEIDIGDLEMGDVGISWADNIVEFVPKKDSFVGELEKLCEKYSVTFESSETSNLVITLSGGILRDD